MRFLCCPAQDIATSSAGSIGRANRISASRVGISAHASRTDAAGTDKLEVDTAGSDVYTVQHPETDKLEVDSAGTDVFTVQMPGEEVTEYGRHTYGNIGVTSAMDLIRQELEIDEKDFVYNAICEFINLYTVYA